MDENPWTLNALGAPVTDLITRLGPCHVIFTSGEHAHVVIGRSQTARDPGPLDVLTWRSIRYAGTLNLYAATGWGEDNADVTRAYGLRHVREGNIGLRASARPFLVDAILDAVREFVRANPVILLEAQRNRCERDLGSLAAECDEARDLYLRLQEDYRGAAQRLQAARNAYADATGATRAGEQPA